MVSGAARAIDRFCCLVSYASRIFQTIYQVRRATDIFTFQAGRYMESSKSGPSEIRCSHCGKRILKDNFLVHEARCQLMSSRARYDQPHMQHKPEEEYRPREEKPRPNAPQSNQMRGSQASRQKIFNKNNRGEEEQKIPCTYCGYMQTLLELDLHPNECPYSGKPCTYCGQSYPESLMQEHMQVCTAREPPEESTHIHEVEDRRPYPPYPHYDEDEEGEDEDSYHPFSNFNFLFGNHFPSNSFATRPYTRTYTVNGRTVIQESDGRGGIMRREVIGGQRQPGFQEIGREDLFGRRMTGHPFNDVFTRLVALMAVRQGEVEQGLTKEELKRLTKIKYKPSGSSSEEKDLCTICYCEFERDERIIQLRCKHMYHEECIVKWLEKNAKCPVCKAPQTNRPIHREE